MQWIVFVCFLVIFPASSDAAAVTAMVNGTAITGQELEEAIDGLIPRFSYHRNVTTEKRDEYRQEALEGLIIRELQYQDAVRRGMKPEKELVQARMKAIRDRYKSGQEYRKALEISGLTEEQLREKVRKHVLVQQVVEKTVSEPARMSDPALKEYYEKNTGSFRQPESVRLRIISTRDEKKARDALARARAGEDFGNLAASVSEDKYRIMGGDIGYIHRGRVVPEVENEAFRLDAGSVAGPFKAGEMWYVIRVEDKRPSYQMAFGEVREKLKKSLEEKRSRELMEQWIAALRAKAKIEIMPPAQ